MINRNDLTKKIRPWLKFLDNQNNEFKNYFDVFKDFNKCLKKYTFYFFEAF